MKKRIYTTLLVETLSLSAIIAVLIFSQQKADVEAVSITISPEQILKQQTIQRLSGQSTEIEEVISDQTEAIMGEVAQEVFSDQSAADAVLTARQNLYGILTQEQLSGDVLEAVSSADALRNQMVEKISEAQAANNSALRSYLINTQTQEITGKLTALNDNLKKYNDLVLKGIKIADSIQSKLPKLAPK
jgi:hypothetical protein